MRCPQRLSVRHINREALAVPCTCGLLIRATERNWKMGESIVSGVIGSFIGGLLVFIFLLPKDWLHGRLRRELQISTVEERGPTSHEYGFTEKAVKVTVRNVTDSTIEITDLRLNFCGNYGFPVLQDAPPLREHSALPVNLSPRAAMSWYFPAEKLASIALNLSPKSLAEESEVDLRPQISDVSGKVHKGSRFRFSKDIASHWP